ncbi:MAG: hypothetical protein IT584_02840 [Chlamydiae bacterium]|nr:hypothetical protein [Chlamydiota bacterium]
MAAVSDFVPAVEAGEDFSPPMASDFQKTLFSAGYWINEPSRQIAREVIYWLFSPIPRDNPLGGIALKVEGIFFIVLSLPLVIFAFVLSTPCYLAASYAGPGRFERFDPPAGASSLPTPQKKACIAVINFCAQNPASILSGGQRPPLEPRPDGQTRTAKLIERLLRAKPSLICFQEIDDSAALNEIAKGLTQAGYSCFGDLGCHTLFNHSGLCIAASPAVIDSIAFRRFHLDHVSGIASWCDRGILEVTLPLQGSSLKVLNFHLNSGSSPKDSASRLLQMRTYVAPFLKGQQALSVGDGNLDTSELTISEKQEADLMGLTNALEGKVTCTDKGKHVMLGKNRKDCNECNEKIDIALFDSRYVNVEDVQMEGDYSDHNLIFLTASCTDLAKNPELLNEAKMPSLGRGNPKSSL